MSLILIILLLSPGVTKEAQDSDGFQGLLTSKNCIEKEAIRDHLVSRFAVSRRAKRIEDTIDKTLDYLWQRDLSDIGRDRVKAADVCWSNLMGRLLVIGIIMRETGFRPWIVGTVGEVGLMQVIPYEDHIRKGIKGLYCHVNVRGVCEKGAVVSRVLSSSEVRRWVRADVRHGVEIGVKEMYFWRAWYYKHGIRKWRYAMSWYKLVHREGFSEDAAWRMQKKYRIWKKRLDGWMWVWHYNWGGRVLYSRRAWNYGRGVWNNVVAILAAVRNTERR